MEGISPLAIQIAQHIEKRVLKDDLSNEDLVYICKDVLHYLNPMTASNYAKCHNISRQAVYKHRTMIDLYGARLVVDNY